MKVWVPPNTVDFNSWVRYLRVLYFRFERRIDVMTNCSSNTDIHLSNVLTDHFSNSLPEKTTKDIPMKVSQYPFKNIFFRLPLSNRGIYLQIIHVRRKAIFTFNVTCITCVNNIAF